MPHLLGRPALAGAVVTVLLAASDPALAAGQRSFVSVTGVDNPTCSVNLPCRSFGAAVAATSPGGEVIVLDSGGYGPVTITQPVSIIAPSGVYAGVSASSGNGVVVTTAASDVVTLRGLTINNTGTGNSGIRFTGDGRLVVQDVTVTGFSIECLLFAPVTTGDLVVERSSFSGCGWGVVVSGGGAGKALLDHVTSHHHANNGIQVQDRAKVVVRNSSSTFNSYGAWSLASAPNATELTVEDSDLSNNGSGAVIGGFDGSATMRLSKCQITQNGTGVWSANGGSGIIAGTAITGNGTGITYSGSGVANSQGNNLISGNGTDGTSPTVVGSK